MFVLYERPPAWGLPSVCTSCTEVEAYLRLAKADFAVEHCNGPQKSPSGSLPAVEDSDEVAECAAGSSETRAAAQMISFIKKKGVDLDAHLSAAEKADVLAFTTMVQSTLVQATMHSTWATYSSYNAHTRIAFGSVLPFPVSYIEPYLKYRSESAALAGVTAEEVVDKCAAAYGALAARLGRNKFILGSRPCSLDALLFSHLRYHMLAPVMPGALHEALAKHPRLKAYADGIAEEFFQAAAAPPPEDWRGAGGGGAGGAGAGDAKKDKKATEAEARLKRRARAWIAMSGLVVVGYLLLGDSGLFSVEFEDDDDDEGMDD